jgi:hypothetical protein
MVDPDSDGLQLISRIIKLDFQNEVGSPLVTHSANGSYINDFTNLRLDQLVGFGAVFKASISVETKEN